MTDRGLQMVQKFFGLVERMRQHQTAYFRSKMQYDKKESMRYEKLVDEYSRILKKNGLQPTFDEDQQTSLL